ncbi:hypothetical protein KPATCC21470_0841 [Kitasatospora purpeofusca]
MPGPSAEPSGATTSDDRRLPHRRRRTAPGRISAEPPGVLRDLVDRRHRHGRDLLPAGLHRPDPLAPPEHVRALTIVTLAGGLTSTAFAPVTAVLADHFDWRTIYLVLARALDVATVPLHAWALRRLGHRHPGRAPGRPQLRRPARHAPGRSSCSPQHSGR